jgi:hypothetical protein
MAKFKIISVAAIAIAAAALSMMIERQNQVKFRAGEARLQEQSNQLAALTVEQERLSNLLAHATNGHADDSAAELARLRSEAATLKKQTNDLGQPLVKSHQSWPTRPASSQEPRTPEYYAQLRQMAGSRMTEARDIGFAFLAYAGDHQNQSPVNLDELDAYLAKENRPVSGTNKFELVYQGSLDQLQGIPWGSVAVVRDQQPWPGPNGKMMRVYGFADGHSQILSSDDNFQSYEAQHVIMPPTTAPSGP